MDTIKVEWSKKILNEVNMIYFSKQNDEPEYEIGRNRAGNLYMKKISVKHFKDKICTDYVFNEDLKYRIRIKLHRSDKNLNV